jgi:radical SAM superfamily enzyme YgiQ (UPF0313 family)
VPELLAARAEGRRLEDVAGLVVNRNGRQVQTAPREAVRDLDELPFPARRLLAGRQNDYYMGFHRPHALVETSRGCPYRCKFCSVWRFYGGGIRAKSPERVVAELEQAPAPNIFITDDNFLSDVERAHHIADLARERGLRKRYTFQARADTIARHRDLIAHWKDTGPTSIFVGVEAIAEEDLASLHKGSTIADNERALDIMKEVGVGFSCNFIVSPGADPDEFARLREYVRRHGLHGAGYSVLTPLPGTELHEEMKDCLATADYELFDLLHAVTRTRLPLEEFYREFAHLWATSYAIGSSHRSHRLWKLVRALATGSVSLSSMLLGMNMAKMLSDPQVYLVGHRGSRERTTP